MVAEIIDGIHLKTQNLFAFHKFLDIRYLNTREGKSASDLAHCKYATFALHKKIQIEKSQNRENTGPNIDTTHLHDWFSFCKNIFAFTSKCKHD